MDEQHYRGHKSDRGNWNRLKQLFLEKFPHQQLFIEKLKAQKRINPAYHLTRILDIIKFYDDSDVCQTIEACFDYNVFMQGYLENYFQRQLTVEPLPLKLSFDQNNPSIKRALTEYKMVTS